MHMCTHMYTVGYMAGGGLQKLMTVLDRFTLNKGVVQVLVDL